METETNQETDADLESQDSASDTSSDVKTDNSESDQKTEKPKLWQVVRGIQKDLKDLKTFKKEEPKETAKTEVKESDLSSEDIFALIDAKVPQEDVKEVIKASKLLGKSIPETLKDGFVIARLKDLAETRQTASATNTSGSKRTTAKLTDEQLIDKARQGGSVDMEALAEARMNLKKVKK